ncbi:MAG: tRNA lysidine(34) synthetase TilS [Candidatus Omnitrophota bacterium]
MKKLSRSTFLKRVRDTIKHYDMLRPGDRVLVAVSGGPDSVGLLKAFSDLQRSLKIEIVVGNLDHGIRGKESARDSDFVKRLSEKLGLVFAHKKIKLGTRAKGKKSLEELAREERYAFLKEAAKKNKCGVIATGHTLDDQAETVLMRIITGASPAGVAGIPPIRQDGRFRLIRPFIRTQKKDVQDYLEASGQEHVEDRTNLDVKIKRNKVRLEVLPQLEKVNPRIKRSLANLADAFREDFLLPMEDEERASRRNVKEGKGSVVIKIADLVLQPKMLRKAIFKESIKRAGGNIKKLTYRHWMDMDYLLRAGEKGKSLDFPGGIKATKRDREIMFEKRRN